MPVTSFVGAFEVIAADGEEDNNEPDVGKLLDCAARVVEVRSFKSLAATGYADSDGFAL
jgi:hypothetical protein